VNAYNALGLVTQATFGNGIVRNLGYDNRGRLTSLADGSLYSFTLGYAPDSNILTGNDSLNGNWTYTYDDFGRLATSGKTGQAFEYKYDQFSNRWQQNVTQGSGPAPQYTFDANNHITTSGVTYDAAGNILNDGFHAYTYDAEGRVLTVDGSAISYAYDAIGQRVSKVVSGVEKDYIYDHAGRAVSELGSGGAWARGEVYAGGMQVATYVSNTTYFHHTDWLGTLRALSDPSGAAVVTCTSLAYGDSQSCNSTYSALNYTGQWWDAESNLTHFLFRQLSTTQGRWTTPDPAGMGTVSPGNPQSWNRYAYVLNSPLNFVDPLGLECWIYSGRDENGQPIFVNGPCPPKDPAYQDGFGQSGCGEFQTLPCPTKIDGFCFGMFMDGPAVGPGIDVEPEGCSPDQSSGGCGYIWGCCLQASGKTATARKSGEGTQVRLQFDSGELQHRSRAE
jgi:RHS repeat-associated protein